ncbi:Histone-lysine N-methyltransferase SETMAR [Eumeta japonica]|uniref:Histone-lysine N-methyltransferase SETMAR n=1 Tax=Eumeta variegata TaxID=151549 RepID=A0A4C1SVC7_EUMVA|nr:Histone-lysine N-methyltransferase SETMAR [Eumeta japonica]
MSFYRWAKHQFGSLLTTANETQTRNREKTAKFDKQKGVVFHHDNVRPRTSLATQQILEEFGWEVLMHPPHRRDLVPSATNESPSVARCPGLTLLGLPSRRDRLTKPESANRILCGV